MVSIKERKVYCLKYRLFLVFHGLGQGPGSHPHQHLPRARLVEVVRAWLNWACWGTLLDRHDVLGQQGLVGTKGCFSQEHFAVDISALGLVGFASVVTSRCPLTTVLQRQPLWTSAPTSRLGAGSDSPDMQPQSDESKRNICSGRGPGHFNFPARALESHWSVLWHNKYLVLALPVTAWPPRARWQHPKFVHGSCRRRGKAKEEHPQLLTVQDLQIYWLDGVSASLR